MWCPMPCKAVEVISFMHTVLFQTDQPTRNRGRAEFYEIWISKLADGPSQRHILRETHGWWDNELMRPVIDKDAVAVSVIFNSCRGALKGFCRRKEYRAKEGFVHSLIWHPTSGIPMLHFLVD